MSDCQWRPDLFLFTKRSVVSGQALSIKRTSLACGKFEAAFRERIAMDEQRPVQGQVQIKADEKELQGQYSNLVMVHHNLEEFTLNFIYIFPNGTQGKLLNSTIVSPGHAKRIWRALSENIARYEAQFGAIKEAPEGGGPTPNVGFVQ
jgi:hypothetical protein